MSAHYSVLSGSTTLVLISDIFLLSVNSFQYLSDDGPPKHPDKFGSNYFENLFPSSFSLLCHPLKRSLISPASIAFSICSVKFCRLSILISVCLRVYVSLDFCLWIQENVRENWTVPVLRYYITSPAAPHKKIQLKKQDWKSRTIWSDFSQVNSQRIFVVHTIIFTQSLLFMYIDIYYKRKLLNFLFVGLKICSIFRGPVKTIDSLNYFMDSQTDTINMRLVFNRHLAQVFY